MTDEDLEMVVELEERLARAMRASDVQALDELLADDLMFTNHQGLTVSKRVDLELHRSGLLKLDSLNMSDRDVRKFGDVAIVAVKVELAGRHADNHFESTFRFTRVWARIGLRWQIVAAHASLVAA